jgi:hypothetical protein
MPIIQMQTNIVHAKQSLRMLKDKFCPSYFKIIEP